jgi:uncharacterized protein YbjQ (UPF0145 family)
MTSIKLRIAAALPALLVLLAARPVTAEMHATAEFAAGTTRPATIALLPAQVNLIKQRMIRMESEVEEAGMLESHLTGAVAAGLDQKGYEVRVVSPEAINSDPQLQSLVVEANRQFDELLGNVSARLRKQIESRRYHAGETLTLLAEKLGVDAVAFVRMQVYAAAKGVQIMNMGMAGSQTMMSVSLVDGDTTDIEAYVTLPIMRRGKVFGGYDDIMKDPDVEMARFAESTLNDLLAADPSLRAKKADDDVLGDIESLLAE